MSFRKILFWLHLVAGLIAGLVVGVMAFTGAALAYEKEIVAWVERDARRFTPPTETSRLPFEQLLRNARERRPDARPGNAIFSRDPTTAVAFTTGRNEGFYANPFSGEIREGASEKTREFMRIMNAWHRTLALTGDHRAFGKAVTGACNFAFLFLGISGLFLWWPRSWSWRSLRAVVFFDVRLSGKARDWNWHNVVGIWCAPVLIVLTATALPISYRWAGDLIYKITRTEAPTPGAGLASSPAVEVPNPPTGAKPLSDDALLAAAQQLAPRWEQITVRLGIPAGKARSFIVRESIAWPRTATTTLTLDPFNGSLLRRESFSDLNLGRQIRTWTRFLHTGEALGRGGQLIAGLASLGACVLVYSGFALSIRRFFGKRNEAAASTSVRV